MLSRTDLVDTLVDAVGDLVLYTDVRSASSTQSQMKLDCNVHRTCRRSLIGSMRVSILNIEEVIMAIKLTSLVSGHVNACS